MSLPIVLDIILAIGMPLIGIIASGREQKQMKGKALQYFTVQSNIFCSFISTICAIWAIVSVEPLWLLILKFSSTCAVTLTFVTVFCYLGPKKRNWGFLISGPNFWMHLVFPLLAIASLLLRSPLDMPFAVSLAGLVPVILYGLLYAKKVVFDPPQKRWEDLYGFTQGVDWKKSMIGMFCASCAVSFGLWALLRALS